MRQPTTTTKRRPLHASRIAAAIIAIAAAACSPADWSNRADRQVYAMIGEKNITLFGEPVEFDIETPHSAKDPREIEAISIISERRNDDQRRIDLDDALAISVESRRDYQNERESLYLTALNLTRARHDYSPNPYAGSTATLEQETLASGGTQNRTTTARNRAGFNMLFKSGGSLAIDVAQDILRFHSGGGSPPATRAIGARLTQPLLRGAGAIATESLTQSERDVIYAIRNFTRFQHTNALDVINNYCRILQEKDRVRNEYSNYRNLVAFTDRATELARDRLPRFQVDQARQDELRARARYISAVNSYQSRIDSFKVFLGLPPGGDLMIDDSVLRTLEQAGLPAIPLDATAAFDIAISKRLDLLNEIDRFEDAKRRLEVAADAFKPGLNLFAGVDAVASSRGNRTKYSTFDPDLYRSRLGFELDIPVDNLDARNSYRRAQIAFERQLRQLSLTLDRVHADLRSGIRGLDLARQTFDIQRNALQLANQRVEAVNLLLDANRAETRDLLEARNAELAARNALTSALIDYHLTRLAFLHDIGIFDHRDQAIWTKHPDFPGFRGNSGNAADVKRANDNLIPPEELFQEPEDPAS